MVHVFTIEDDQQHSKCKNCLGATKECLELVQCSYAPCGKYNHVDCIDEKLETSKLDNLTYWYCDQECKDLHKPDRILLEAKKNPNAAEAIKILEKRLSESQLSNQTLTSERDSAFHAAEVMDQKVNEIEEEKKKLQLNLSKSMLSSTMASKCFTTANDSSLFGVSSLQTSVQPSSAESARKDFMNRLIQRAKDIEAAKLQQSEEKSDKNPYSILSNTFTADDMTQAHAIASLTLGLSERRKQLPRLPEFNGRGSEWLYFKNIYQALRKEGKYDDREMNAKLSTALKGTALEYCRLWLFSSRPDPDKIVKDLESRFFSKVAVMTDALDVVNDVQPIKRKDRSALEILKRAVDGYINVCTDVNEIPPLLVRIPESVEDKLPDDILEKWNRLTRHEQVYGSWHDFSKFLEEATLDLKVRAVDRKKESKDSKPPAKGSSPTTNLAKVHMMSSDSSEQKSQRITPQIPHSNSTRGNFSRGRGRGGYGNAPGTRSRIIGESPVCDYCNCGTTIYRCPNFARKKFDIKMAHCQLKGYCSRCLRKGHAAITCPNTGALPKCRVDGCNDSQNHTTVMHPPECSPRENGTFQTSVINSHINDVALNLTLFQVAVLNVEDINGDRFPVTVFIDTGSNTSLMTVELYKRLGLDGSRFDLMVEWCAAGVKKRSKGSFKTQLALTLPNDPSQRHVLKNIVSMENLQLPLQEQNEKMLHEMFPHLKCIQIPEFSMQRPQILIGLPHRKYTVPNAVIYPPNERTSIVAERSAFGWVLSCADLPSFNLNTISVSPAVPKASENHFKAIKASSNEVEIHDTCKITLEQLNQLVKHYLNVELTGKIDRDGQYFTADDRRSIEVLKNTMKIVNNRYEVGLLWREDNVELPNNSSTALRRLKSTEAALKKKNLVTWAIEHHKTLVNLGFAREATPEELNPATPHKRINYVIGFVVINENKVPPKPRWVVDTSCKHNGISLNSALLKGQDNLIPLTQALFHFRERAIAICGDVEKQFHQVNIIKEDIQCQRYFWRDCDETREPKTFIHTAMLFGPTDSPSKANAVRIEHATNSKDKFPNASRAALDSMYMDDLFDSQNTVKEAVSVAKHSIKMFSEISWKLVDFRSNSTEVLESLPIDHVNKSVAVELSKDDPTLMCCKVLGLYWNPTLDIFEFKQTAERELRLKSLNDRYHPTKLEVLSFVLRIFDCLGSISHFIVRGRMIIQQTWKAQLDWSHHIPDDIFEAWVIWLRQIDQIAKLQIPRHYGYSTTEVKQIELHIFTDASEKAYAAVGYFRFTLNDESIKIVQVMAKARVAPLKEKTVPRLELDGTVIGTRLAKIIIEQHKRITIVSTTLWSDSKIVLSWIRGVNKRLIPYVAPRVSEIRDTFDISQWRYCPSQQNPADHGTKCTEIDFSDHNHCWFTGPKFLYQSQEEWPKEEILKPIPHEATVLAAKFAPTAKEIYYAGIFEGVSPKIRANWEVYKRVTARALRFLSNYIAERRHQPLNLSKIFEPKELVDAEKEIILRIQNSLWREEIDRLSRGRPLTKSHSKDLMNLPLIIGVDGLIRCRTRFSEKAEIPFDMKFPIVLPNAHETVDAMIREAHERNNHIGIEATVAKLRSRYYIIASRRAVQRNSAKCLYCINMRARPYKIPTGNLPDIRVTPSLKAFDHVGCDCFGPFTIFSGESKRKREVHVVIFTCLTSRAIYLRRLNKLSTDEMWLAVQELWTRRGPLISMRSDNGKNFVGCANILTAEFLQGLSSRFGIKWIFNPPYTPQWGGAWERLIKDIKRAMKAVLKDRIVPQRVFDLILYQVEDTMNSRPLTHVPCSPEDEYPITPNLMVKLHPGYEFMSDTANIALPSRPDWSFKKAQKFSKQIMTRWTKEYLPTIARHNPKTGPYRDIKHGDYVIYCDPVEHPQNWQRGIVIATHTGRDNFTRAADIKLKSGKILLNRSAYRLARLAIEDGEFQTTTDVADTNINMIHFLTESFNDFTSHSRRNSKISTNRAQFHSSENRAHNNNTRLNVIKIYHLKIQKMSIYKQLNRNEATEIIKALWRTQFLPSAHLHNNAASSLALNLVIFASNSENLTNCDERSLKLTIDGGIHCFTDIIMTLASLQAEPLWIKFQDQSQRAPLIAFIQLKRASDANKLLEYKEIQVLSGKFKVSKPTNCKPIQLSEKGFEHALIRIPFEDSDWKFVISRHVDSESRTDDPGIPRAAPAVGLIWKKRYCSSFMEDEFEAFDGGEWKDFRVLAPSVIHEPINDAAIKPTEDFRKQRAVKFSNDSIHVHTIAATPAPSIPETSNNLESIKIHSIEEREKIKLTLKPKLKSIIVVPQLATSSKPIKLKRLKPKTSTTIKPNAVESIANDVEALKLTQDVSTSIKKTKRAQDTRKYPVPIIVKEEPENDENVIELAANDDLMEFN